MSTDLQDRLERELTQCLRDVGRYQMQQRGRALAVSDKADTSPVTEVDLYSHRLIKAALLDLEPHTPILSEESSQLTDFTIANCERFWCIDPLDGTRDYIEGTDHFAINVALFVQGQVEWAMIYHPASEEFLVADRATHRVYFVGADGHKNPVTLPLQSPHIRAVLTSARVSMNDQRKEQIRSFAQHLADDARIVPISSSYKFFLLLKNEAQAYVRKAPCMIWDIAPGFLAAELAGMHIVDLKNLMSFTWPMRALDVIPSFAITMARGDLS
ncbi:MAG TPA: inositol monophosphatase family protein [Bdellovibrionota bacterium]|nr:inositol monophosphatase family protein [Bdellovibrionota bacterium]